MCILHVTWGLRAIWMHKGTLYLLLQNIGVAAHRRSRNRRSFSPAPVACWEANSTNHSP